MGCEAFNPVESIMSTVVIYREARRVMNHPLIFEKVIGRMPSGEMGTIIIPKFREISALELADDIPMN